MIGFSMNATDFATPNAIKATSLGDTLKNADWQKFSITDFSISLMYREGFSNKIDLPARYNGLFIEYTGTGV
ncbi:MAG: hypothetical protein P0Y53_15655 [Candidatus Pseudobacter hemicellulosilyticus]|uniref:Uncharacterized protein n=1 Tax=Candidatus Pseudobacter hemicellulosilyticus TaxID=3121375 RepID=A0AAJ5WMP1_9BACT|nr:MAG: hypothetical protein P0Y53_15655 [Pseudobacter sp.]